MALQSEHSWELMEARNKPWTVISEANPLSPFMSHVSFMKQLHEQHSCHTSHLWSNLTHSFMSHESFMNQLHSQHSYHTSHLCSNFTHSIHDTRVIYEATSRTTFMTHESFMKQLHAQHSWHTSFAFYWLMQTYKSGTEKEKYLFTFQD